jgi:hypothetical protein
VGDQQHRCHSEDVGVTHTLSPEIRVGRAVRGYQPAHFVYN